MKSVRVRHVDTKQPICELGFDMAQLCSPGRLAAPLVCGTLKNTRDQGHADELGEALGLHLGHDVGAVNFNRAWADPEIEGNDLVGLPGHQALEHLALAIG